MPKYTDGFVVPVPKKKLKQYLQIARKASKVWRDHGALQYMECVADDMKSAEQFATPFPRGVRLKAGEVPIFAFIVFKSRAHRDKVNAAVMKDPRIAAMCDPKDMPFDCKRMLYGGFKVMVDA